jgi:hypothetical protein
MMLAVTAASGTAAPIVDNLHPVKHPVYGGGGAWAEIETGIMGSFDKKSDAENWLNGTHDATGNIISPAQIPEFAYRYTSIVCLCVSV